MEINRNQSIDLSYMIKHKASELGFSDCGISGANRLMDFEKHLVNSVESGYNGEMSYLKRSLKRRLDPRLLLDNARSVISLLISYNTNESQNLLSVYKVSKYAYGNDYHVVIKEKLSLLESYLKEIAPFSNTISFVDSSPVLEKALAKKSGLGWIGKNTLLINKKFGSFCFLGEIITDIEIDTDEEFAEDLCGNCSKCIDACPSNAIIKPYVLDARKCISYNNIELRKEVSAISSEKLSGWIYGCDICQNVCPWNRGALKPDFIAFELNKEMLNLSKDDWENMGSDKFKSIFSHSAIARITHPCLMRNISICRQFIDSFE